MKKLIASLFAVLLFVSIVTVCFADKAAAPNAVEIEEYDEFFPYSLAVSALTAEYGVGDDAIPLEYADDDIGPFATRRIMVRTAGELHDWEKAVRVLHFEDEYVLQFETEAETQKAYAVLKADEDYQGVFLDLIVQQDPLIEEDDVLASSFNGDQAHYSWGVGKMGLDDMENRLIEAGYGQADSNPPVVVAVVDSGVSNNRYINGRLLTGYNYVSQNTNTGDDNGHGTHVAGTICDGTPQRVKILPIKSFGANGKGSIANIKNGIEYAISQGADVINLSLGSDDTGQSSDYFDSSLQKAYQQGITVIAAAGNSSMDTQYAYPANNPNVITIAALDENMSLADYSNYGYEVDFALPGSNIQSCVPTGIESMNGTSMAAPHAAAAAADLLCWNPNYDPDTIRSILIDYSVNLGDSYLYGNGWIDFNRFYIVSYNANGGSGGPRFQLKTPGSALPLAETVPSHSSDMEIGTYTLTLDANGGSVDQSTVSINRTTDYTFLNWNTKADGTGTNYLPNASYTEDADLSLYAQWGSNTSADPFTLPVPTREGISAGSYTVMFDANGGSVSQNSLTANRANVYTCSSWNTQADGSGTSYAPGSDYIADDSRTLFAQWDSSITTEAIPLPTPTWENHTFLGWAASSDASSGMTGSYTPDDNITLFAVWEKTVYSSGISGDSLSWVLYSDGSFIISGEGAIDSSSAWNSVKDRIKSISIQEGITSIGSWVFSGCRYLTEVTLPESLTGVYSYAFSGCSKLTSVTVKGATYFYDDAFSSCDNLKRVNIQSIASWCSCSFNNAKSNPLNYAKELYLNNQLVTDLVIPDSITRINSNAFYNCSSITSLTIPESVTRINDSAFSSCSSLASVTILGTTYIYESAFYRCGNLNRVNIASLDAWFQSRRTIVLSDPWDLYVDGQMLTDLAIPDSVSSLNSKAFYNCSSITSVTIPETVTSISGSAFCNCSSLTNITIPDSVKRIESSAFSGCGSLAGIELPVRVSYIGDYAFYKCESLENVIIPERVTQIGNYAFSYCSSLATVTVSEGVANIGDYAFKGCSELTSVTLPSSIANNFYTNTSHTYNNETYYNNGAFEGCTSLESAVSPYWSNFADCPVTAVTIPSTVKTIAERAFNKCSSLTSVSIPEGVEGISDYAFYYCTGLASMTIPEGVTSIGYNAFYSCSSMGRVTIPGSVRRIGGLAFAHCISLTDVTISEGVNSIGASAFSHCSNLKYIAIPESITNIESSAFLSCTSLWTAAIPAGITDIESGTFSNCSNLRSVLIPESVTTIDWEAFSKCYSLGRVYYGGTQEQWEMISISSGGDGNFYLTSAAIHCNVQPDFVLPAALTAIEEEAFAGGVFTYVKLSENTVSIGQRAFGDCQNLAYIYIPETTTGIDPDAFDNVNGLTIFGKAGSTAEGYAQAHGFSFTAVA